MADSYDAMTSNRSYRKYMSQDKVRSEIENNIGSQFDPDVAKCMLDIIDADVNYELGDWGTQFGKLIVAYKKWSSRERVEEKVTRMI